MRYRMIIFFTIALLIYSLANLYLYFKGYNAIPALQKHRLLYAVIFFTMAAAFIVAKFLESRHSSVITDILNIMGGFWLAFMLYGFLFLFLSDIIYVILRITRVLNSENIHNYRYWSIIIAFSAAVILIVGGFINAVIPTIKEYNIKINKPAGETRSLRIAAVSDIHLGSIIRKRSIKKLSNMLLKMDPDVVFLLGDIVDGEIGPVMRGDLLQYFTCPKCKYELLAITGNHEFIGGANRTIPYIESKGIRLLNDEVYNLNGIQVIGRKDRDSERFYGRKRKALSELMKDVDTTKPVILLDHQPFNMDESVKYGVDLKLSGHTHNGQMWPLNYVTEMIYELSYGYLKKGNTHIIVSSGYGLWGPRVRSASRSEVLLINLEFSGN